MKTRIVKFTICFALLLVVAICAVSCDGNKCSGTGAGHTYSEWSIDTATCTEAGTQSRRCTSCDYREERATLPLGHQNEIVAAKAPTCDEVGYNSHTKCYKCGYSDNYTEIAATGHSLVDVAAKEPGCVEVGYNAHRACTKCDYKEEGYVEIAALGHTDVYHAAVAPTCTEEGTKTYITCEKCDYSTAIIKVEKLPHKYGEWHSNTATCTEGGEETRNCTVCTAPDKRSTEPLGHDEIAQPGQPATCTKGGWNPYLTCGREGCDFNTKILVEAKGHSYDEWRDNTATCTEGGREYRVCEVCGNDVEVRDTEPLGHTFGEWENDTATCQRRGVKERTCSVCEFVDVQESEVINHVVTGWKNNTATCISAGVRTGNCDMCGAFVSEEIQALGHSVEWKGDTATCEAGGNKYGSCSVCAAYFYVTSEPLGHDFGEWGEDSATCELTGEKQRVCQREGCDVQDTVATEPLGHDMVWDKPVWPKSCTATGLKHGVCSNCGKEVEERVIYKGHVVEEWTVSTEEGKIQSCTTAGERKGKCTVCGEEVVEVLKPLGHQLGEWSADNATCTEGGKITAYCTRENCDYKYEEDGHECDDRCDHRYKEEKETLALGHNLTWTLDGTSSCAEGEKYVASCSDCEHKEEFATGKKDHVVTEWTENTATCVEAGEFIGKCSICGEEVRTPSARLEHLYGAWVIDKIPTCTERGTEVRTCTREGCGDSESRDVDPKGHSIVIGEANITNDCTQESWAAYEYCTNDYCSVKWLKSVTVYDSEKKLLEGAITIVDGIATEFVYNGVTYTLTATSPVNVSKGIAGSYVAKDKSVTEEANANNSFAIAIDASNIRFIPLGETGRIVWTYEIDYKNGVEYTTYTTQNIVEATEGHDIEEHEAVAATCTTPGWDKYVTCKNPGCQHTTYVEIPATGHNFEGERFYVSLPTCDVCGEIQSEGDFEFWNETYTIQNFNEYVLSDDESYYVLVKAGARIVKKSDGNSLSDSEFVIIPSTYNGLPVTEIDPSAFSDGENISTIIIQKNMENIPVNAFDPCVNLGGILVSNNDYYLAFDYVHNNIGDLYRKDPNVEGGYILVKCASLTEEYVVPTITVEHEDGSQETSTVNVTAIEDYAFSGCSNLTEVVIPASVKSIGAHAFENCEKLAKVTFATVTENEVTKTNVVSIGDYAFAGCTALNEIVLPASVTEVGSYAFAGAALTAVVIPDSVTTLGEYAFAGCESLESVVIGNGVKSLNKTFADCTALTSVTFGTAVNEIGNGAFYGCSALQSVVIPETVIRIGTSAFAYCDSLTTVVIPKSLETIDNFAFIKCKAIEKVYYTGTAEDFAKVKVGESNKTLTDNVYTYSETEPTVDGNFWHYVEEVITVWEKKVAEEGGTEPEAPAA